MHVLKTICVSSARGVEAAKLFDKVAFKYLLGLDFLFQFEAV